MTDLQTVLSDLAAEAQQIDRMIDELPAERWSLPTPATGWTIADQVAHLSFIFTLAGTAAVDGPTFEALVAGAQNDFDGAVNAALGLYRDETPETLRARWKAERQACLEALATVPPGDLVPWLVNPLPPEVLTSAGLMEVFAHGQDIADALGTRIERTDRLRHLVGFAVLTRDFGYQSHGLTPPAAPFRFEITAPSGGVWEYGPVDAAQRVRGPAEDFCLLVTRRRHPADLAVTASGFEAERWLGIAQAYRGPAGAGRVPGQFAGAVRR